MRKEEKNVIIEQLTEKLNNATTFYLTDISNLNAKDTGDLRRLCYSKEVELVVVKNTLLKKALERSNKQVATLYPTLNYPTSIMITDQSTTPAKLIKEFRKTHEKPLLKAAYVQESVFVGDNQLETLMSLKSKNELIGEVIGLLQSPIQRVISSLQSGGNTIAGLVKALAEREQ